MEFNNQEIMLMQNQKLSNNTQNLMQLKQTGNRIIKQLRPTDITLNLADGLPSTNSKRYTMRESMELAPSNAK